MLELFQTLWQFALDNAEIAIFLMTATAGGAAWFGKQAWQRFARRKKRLPLPVDTFPFTVIPPNTADVERRIYASKQQTPDDPLADFNIPYQQRVSEQDTQQVLMERLEARRWLLILGPTGLGKTREAGRLAQAHAQQGWTVMRLNNHQLLTVPDSFPIDRLERQPKLLFVLDNLNQAMVSGRVVSGRVADVAEPESKAALLESPLQMRLLETLKFYTNVCGVDRVRVVATARNEKVRTVEDLPSEWEKLGIEKYEEFWQRFDQYELPEPEDRAVAGMLAAAAAAAGVEIESDLLEIAQTNDCTFRNPVENLERIKNQGEALSAGTFQSTLSGSWERRYQTVKEKYGPVAGCLYDSVDLLRQVNVALSAEWVLMVAQIVAGESGWQGWWQNRRRRSVLETLETTERILEPRDGQIEAKGYSASLERYFEQICQQLSARVEQQETVSVLMSVLVVAHEREKYSTALDLTERMLRFSPAAEISSLLFYGKGIALSALGRKEEAIAAYDQALAIKPDKHEALNNKGVDLSALGRNEAAVAAYDQALAIKPDKHEALYNKGIALSALGRKEEAIAAYDQALAIKPDYHEALNNKGNDLSALGRKEDAVAAYDQALAIKPDYHDALNNKGVALSALGRNEDAVAAYDQALAIKPDKHEALYNKGVALSALGRNEDAVAAYDQALAIKPDYHDALNNKGVDLSALGRKEEAIAACDQALAIKPDYHDALNNKGNALGALGRKEEAIAAYDQALAIKPDKHEALYGKGYALGALDRKEEAIAAYDQALAIKPDYASAWYNKACCYALNKQIDKALYCLHKAIMLEGGTKYIEMAKTDTDFDPVRNHPDFQSLLRES
ncbi:MAG: tetratricopeptide repeat protein [Cyanobacteria bacterium P01_D01_bin.1]